MKFAFNEVIGEQKIVVLYERELFGECSLFFTLRFLFKLHAR